jgi:hypothetical protein
MSLICTADKKRWIALVAAGAALVPAPLTHADPPGASSLTRAPERPVFSECESLALSARLSGRGPVSWKWTINGAGVPSCEGVGQAAGQDLSKLAISCTVAIQDFFGNVGSIFADGFESGDTSAWSTVKSSPYVVQVREPIPAQAPAAATLVVAFQIWDGPDTSVPPWETAQVLVDVIPGGVPTFTAAPIRATAGTGASLTYPASGATTWRWELEDPDQGTRPCPFPAAAPCVALATATDSLIHVWAREGTFGYRVTISNCTAATDHRDGSVELVEVSAAPVVRAFDVAPESLVTADPGTAGRPCKLTCAFNCTTPGRLQVTCKAGMPIRFTVATDGEAIGYRFDWDGLGAGGSFGAVTASLVHTYGADAPEGFFSPAVRAVAGSVESAPVELIGSFGTRKVITIGTF